MLTASSEVASLLEQEGSAVATAELALGGMHCSACATRIQRALGRLPAVASASVNLATTRAYVAYDPGRARSESPVRCRQRYGLHRHPRGPWPLRRIESGPGPLGSPSTPLVASFGIGSTGCIGRSRIGSGRMDRSDSRHRRGDRRRLAILEGQRSAASPRGDQHGHAHRSRNAGRAGGQCSRGHRSGRAARAPRRRRRLRGPVARSDGPSHRVHPGDGTCHRNRARARAAEAMHSLLSLRPPMARVVANVEDEEGVLVPPESFPWEPS